MKKTAMLAAFTAALFISCNTSKLGTDTDDVYAVPSEERAKAEALRAEKARQEALARQEAAKETTTISINDDAEKVSSNNQYYKDPDYNRDDYYDYEYAARINRFYRPIGVGYYDSYYTNMYSYNNNPAFYGTSIYSGYGWGMPSTQFTGISFGISSGWGYGGYGAYNGWNSGFYNSCYPYYSYDPWCSSYSYYGGGWGNPYGYNPYNNWSYMNGYNNGYYNGYYQGMYNSPFGYYNSYDVNSNYRHLAVAPRNSNVGGNARNREASAGNENLKYYENTAEQQQNRPRFNSGGQRIMRDNGNNGRIDNSNRPANTNDRVYENTQPANNGRGSNRNRNNDRVMERQEQHQAPSRRESQPVFSPDNNGGGRNNSGGESPRNSGSGGGSSPRRR